MKKFVGAAMMAGAAMAGTAGVAHAEGSFSGTVGFVSDYIFRGISQTDSAAAIQGSLDYTNGMFYAGAWGSSLASGTEIDLYAGITPTTGPISWNLGLLGYFYPGAADDDTQANGEFDYYELKIAPSMKLTDALTVGAAYYYSPDFYGETGTGMYWEVNAGYAFSDALSFSAAFGEQNIEDVNGNLAGSPSDSYTTWNVGATYAYSGFKFGLQYVTTNLDENTDALGLADNLTDDAVVFSIGRSL